MTGSCENNLQKKSEHCSSHEFRFRVDLQTVCNSSKVFQGLVFNKPAWGPHHCWGLSHIHTKCNLQMVFCCHLSKRIPLNTAQCSLRDGIEETREKELHLRFVWNWNLTQTGAGWESERENRQWGNHADKVHSARLAERTLNTRPLKVPCNEQSPTWKRATHTFYPEYLHALVMQVCGALVGDAHTKTGLYYLW